MAKRKPKNQPQRKAPPRGGTGVALVLVFPLVVGALLGMLLTAGITAGDARVDTQRALTVLRLGEAPAWSTRDEGLFNSARTQDTPHNSTVTSARGMDLPAIAIVIDDLGEDLTRTREAIALPVNVTLSFLPYPDGSRELSRQAHMRGHEVLVHLSMQPMGVQNPGPMALMANLPPDEIANRVSWALSRVSDYEGANNHMGSRFTLSRTALMPVMQVLGAHRLFFLDSRTTAGTQGEIIAREAGLLTGSRDVFLDDDESAEAVERQLELTEQHARTHGTAIAIGHPHPQTLTALTSWTARLSERGYKLLPVRDVLRLRADRGPSHPVAAATMETRP